MGRLGVPKLLKIVTEKTEIVREKGEERRRERGKLVWSEQTIVRWVYGLGDTNRDG